MVERRFQHLVCPIAPFISRFHSSFILFQPVCSEDGNVVGLLDITKVFREAIDKVERSPTASAKLYKAVAGVQSELGGIASNPQATAMPAYVEESHEKIALPDLTTVMDSRTQPLLLGLKQPSGKWLTSCRSVELPLFASRRTLLLVLQPMFPESLAFSRVKTWYRVSLLRASTLEGVALPEL
jgi:hypothetical protein